MSIEERFWSKVEKQSTPPFWWLKGGCWEWTAGVNKNGYGTFSIGSRIARKMRLAHSLSYEWTIGPIPCGLEIDHLCRNPRCVNPAQLEAVTHLVNIRRGRTWIAAAQWSKKRYAKVTHCPRGHPYSGNNLYSCPKGYRRCRECNKQRMRL